MPYNINCLLFNHIVWKIGNKTPRYCCWVVLFSWACCLEKKKGIFATFSVSFSFQDCCGCTAVFPVVASILCLWKWSHYWRSLMIVDNRFLIPTWIHWLDFSRAYNAGKSLNQKMFWTVINGFRIFRVRKVKKATIWTFRIIVHSSGMKHVLVSMIQI